MNPNNLTIDELVHYSAQYAADPWAKRLAQYLSDIIDIMSANSEHKGIDDFLENYEITCSDLRWKAESAENERAQAEDEREIATRKYQALKYDCAHSTHAKTIIDLKSIITVGVETEQKLRYSISTSEQRIRCLEEENRDLKEKLGMWDILKTE